MDYISIVTGVWAALEPELRDLGEDAKLFAQEQLADFGRRVTDFVTPFLQGEPFNSEEATFWLNAEIRRAKAILVAAKAIGLIAIEKLQASQLKIGLAIIGSVGKSL